ncbi:MAG: hypothetical protein U5L95_02600 [Candidatus Saccharibacteria bacterium]|nr:hypothetical protein [Candidatus Saccharibacteria bacterium]
MNASSVLIAEAQYLHGVKHGMWKIWTQNGQLDISNVLQRGQGKSEHGNNGIEMETVSLTRKNIGTEWPMKDVFNVDA